MNHELEKLGIIISASGGVESLQADVDLIERFLVHANGCGVESLNTVSGALIESGLSTRYPDHFKVGSGIEGLRELVDKLKTGISGLKKRFKGKLPAELKKAAVDLESAIKKTYGNRSWYSDKDETGKSVSTVELAKVVGDVKSAEEVSSTPAAAFKLYDVAINDYAKNIKAYITETHKVVDQLNKLGDDDEALKKYAAEQFAILRPKLDSLNTRVEIKPGNGAADIKLSKEQCVAIGDEMARIVNWYYNELIDFEEPYLDAVGDSDLDHLGIVELNEVDKLYYHCLHWEAVLGGGEELYAKCADFMKNVLVQMEKMIITALK